MSWPWHRNSKKNIQITIKTLVDIVQCTKSVWGIILTTFVNMFIKIHNLIPD